MLATASLASAQVSFDVLYTFPGVSPGGYLGMSALIQGADGRTSRPQLTSHFCAQGHRLQDIDSAINALVEGGRLHPDGKWLVVR